MKSIEELAKIGIGVDEVAEALNFNKDKKYSYRSGKKELTLDEYNTVIEKSGHKLVTLKKGKKIIVVDEEKEV